LIFRSSSLSQQADGKLKKPHHVWAKFENFGNSDLIEGSRMIQQNSSNMSFSGKYMA
jgi:hypothetical protein